MKRHLQPLVLCITLLCPALSHAVKVSKPRRAHAVTKKAPQKPVQPPHPPQLTPAMLRGKIVFEQDNALWTMNPDGQARVKLSGDVVRIILKSGGVSLSPDLRQVAFLGKDPQHRDYSSQELFVMNLDGTHKRQLTNRDYADAVGRPRFSPDGKHLVYEHGTGGHMGGPMTYSADIWVVDVDGDNHHQVGMRSGYDPYWSHDGKRIYYTNIEGGIYEGSDAPPPHSELWSVNVDGSDPKASPGQETQIARSDISPDRQWFVARQPDLRYGNEVSRRGELLLHNGASGEEKRLTFDSALEVRDVAWLPHNNKIAFMALRWFGSGSQLELWVANIDGTEMHPIALNALVIAWPT